jgi:hypothetical protein
LTISIHPYITGVPHRIKYLETPLDYVVGHAGVALMTASEMGDWYRAQCRNHGSAGTEKEITGARLVSAAALKTRSKPARKASRASLIIRSLSSSTGDS